VFTPVSATRPPALQLRVSSETDALIQYKAALERQSQLVDMVRLSIFILQFLARSQN
jgi:uncharacterized protein (DUF1778 family)